MRQSYEELINVYEEAINKANVIKSILQETKDGFIYLTQTCCYGSVTWQTHNNEYLAKQEDDKYYGDNGIVYIYTNNPNHNFTNYSCGGVQIMSEQEIIDMSKEDISMSKAICNWIAKS